MKNFIFPIISYHANKVTNVNSLTKFAFDAGSLVEEIGELVGMDQRTVSYHTNKVTNVNSLVKSVFEGG